MVIDKAGESERQRSRWMTELCAVSRRDDAAGMAISPEGLHRAHKHTRAGKHTRLVRAVETCALAQLWVGLSVHARLNVGVYSVGVIISIEPPVFSSLTFACLCRVDNLRGFYWHSQISQVHRFVMAEQKSQ